MNGYKISYNNEYFKIDIFQKTSYIINMSNEELSDYIVIDQGVRIGKPCIKDTRITVEYILQWLSEGIAVSEIIEKYICRKERFMNSD